MSWLFYNDPANLGPHASYTSSDYYSALWEVVSSQTNGTMNVKAGDQFTVYGTVFTVKYVEPKQEINLVDEDGYSVTIPGWRWSPYL